MLTVDDYELIRRKHLVDGISRRAIGSFREHARFPSEGVAAPGWITGIGWSDHWTFWKERQPAIMVTDTAPFRYPYYRTAYDTSDRIDYERLARVVAGLANVLADLAGTAHMGQVGTAEWCVRSVVTACLASTRRDRPTS